MGVDSITGNVKIQRFKLMAAGEGVEEVYGDDDNGTTRALHVVLRPKRVDTGLVNSSGLTTVTTTYTSGDVLGAGWTLTGMARANGEGGYLKGISIIDRSDVMAAFRLYGFSAAVTFGTDNATPTISDADMDKFQFMIDYTGTWVDLGGARGVSIPAPGPVTGYGELHVPYSCDATSLFIYATTQSANAVFAGGTDSLRLRAWSELI